MMRPLACLIFLSSVAAVAQEPVEVPVPRPEPLLAMDLGGGLSSYIISSHLQTGWARYLETVPATVLRDGIGSWTACQQLRSPEDAEAILGPLHEYGIGVFRYELGWGNVQYRRDLSGPLQLTPGAEQLYRAVLRAANRHGFRLIILLNAHQGWPCPIQSTGATFLQDAPSGSTEVLLQVDDPTALRVGYSGLSNLTDYCAAENLFRAVSPLPDGPPGVWRVTLTKPLSGTFVAGARTSVETLQYRPFGCPQTGEHTYRGWGEYAGLVARVAAEEGMQDGDLDFEVWNELTFGTTFLSIHNYEPDTDGQADWNRMMAEAAQAVRAVFPERATVLNGFANTTFFFGGFWGGRRPEGINGETYHPYGNQWREYPRTALEGNHLAEAYRNVDGFVPCYNTLYPEYRGNWEPSHALIALMQPEMRQLLVAHGHAPPGWKRAMTENGLFIGELQLPHSYRSRLMARPEHYVAKFWLRLYPFYLNKGLYAVCDGSLRNPGDWEDSWEAQFARTKDTRYLAALEPLRRMVALVREATDVPAERLISLHPHVVQLSGHDLQVFGTGGAVVLQRGAEGRPWDPTSVTPQPLYYRDVFCLLPFQVDDDSLAIAVYIQTRNILDDVDDAGRYGLTLPGLWGAQTTVRVYDPLQDRQVPAQITTHGTDVSITLTLTDYPIWVMLDGVPR